MITRKDYLADRTDGAFARYYGEIIEECGGPVKFPCPVPIEEVRAALDAGDLHLNTIPLHTWGFPAFPAKVAKAMRDRGDYPTLAGGTCLTKLAAKLRADQLD